MSMMQQRALYRSIDSFDHQKEDANLFHDSDLVEVQTAAKDCVETNLEKCDQLLASTAKYDTCNIPKDKWRMDPNLNTMNSMIRTLSNRDFGSYMTRISRPRQLFRKQIQCSESYLNPNIVPNRHISDSELQAAAKQNKRKDIEYIRHYIYKEREKAQKRIRVD